MSEHQTRFSSRLFRLFLLASIVPVLIVAAVGYYLVTLSGNLELRSATGTNQSLSRYYNDLLYASITSGLERYEATGEVDSSLIDFLIILGDDSIASDTEQNKLRETLRALRPPRTKGWTEYGEGYLQYLILPIENDTIAAGLIHGASFRSLIDLVQEEQALQSSQQALRGEYLFFLLALFVTLSGGIALLAYWLSSRTSRRLAEPLVQLAEATKRIATGDFSQIVTPTGDEELQQLIGSFNLMSSRLGAMTEQLAQTERVAAWRQVARRFAHELKNPIQPILISLYQIEKKLAESPAYEQIKPSLKAATEELNHLTTLAERFSTLAKMPEVKLEATDLTSLIRSVAELYKSSESKVVLELKLPDTPLMATIDTTYLREALHNLILNSRDACVYHGKINLALQQTGNEILISVADTGQGMDSETIAAARLPYFSTKGHGTGLGLAIVEKSINEMNGRLKLASTPGQGTTVTIILPLEQPGDNS